MLMFLNRTGDPDNCLIRKILCANISKNLERVSYEISWINYCSRSGCLGVYGC